MANELQHRDAETGSTLYFTLRKPNGAAQLWNTAGTTNWEAMTVANWTSYDIAMTESPASSYLYVGTIPAIAGNMVAGWYWAEVYKQAGGSPAIDDEIRGRYFGYWDGTTLRFWASDATHVNGTVQTAGDFLGIWTTAKAAFLDAAITSRAAATLFSGITSVAQWLGLLAGKQVGNSTARTEIRATGAGSGTYDETTDSLEAGRDNQQAAAAAAITAASIPTAAQIDTQLSGTHGAGSWESASLTGAYACTWTVKDGTTVLQGATVSFWLNGVLKGTGATGVAGTVSMSLDAATYTVAISLSGYVFANTTHVVSATSSTWTHTFSITAVTISAPTNAGTATGRLDMHTKATDTGAYCSIYVRQTTRRSGTGHGDSKEWRELVSNALGVIEAPFWKSQAYEAKRGQDGTPVAFTVGTDNTFYLPSILGEP